MQQPDSALQHKNACCQSTTGRTYQNASPGKLAQCLLLIKPTAATCSPSFACMLLLQPCRLAADYSSALLLQPACRGISTLHHVMISAMWGPALLPKGGPSSSAQDLAACSSMTSSAHMLMLYTQLLYGLLLPAAGFCSLEWRLKASYVYNQLGKQLVYGPWGWPRSVPRPATFASRLQTSVSWLLFIIGSVAAVWCASMWLLHRLPMVQCETCADKGTCLEVVPCQGEWLPTQREREKVYACAQVQSINGRKSMNR